MNTRSKLWLAIPILASGILLFGLFLSQPARAAGPWYVAPGGSDSDDCLTPGTPCETINGAIGKATAGDTVYVAEGTYTSIAGSQVVSVTESVNLSGGWDATFTTQGGMSTVDGEETRKGMTVNSGVTTVVESFIVQNCSPIGGIYNWGTLTLNNSVISGNTQVGILNNGTLVLNNSMVSENVGTGIYNGIDQIAGNVTLNNSTISDNTGGDAGVFNLQGSVTLNNSVINGNGNYGISNYDLMSINNSTVSDGGGISNAGTLTLTNSTVTGNLANDGGGIYNSGILLLVDSSVTGNTAHSFGGGISNYYGTMTLNNSTVNDNSSGDVYEGWGGGIYIYYGTVTLNNSTISGNTSQSMICCNAHGGGITNFYGTVFLNNSTISHNTSQDAGGIYNYSETITLKNSILAGNTAVGTSPDCYGTLSSQGYNLIQDTTGCTIIGDTTGNLTGVDPLLGPLQDNGGPTLTHALLPGSPAIDAGNPATPGSGGNACETTDQRGVARPQLAACDMGAFELEAPSVAFSSNAFSVNEDAGTVVITVTLSEALTQTATVDYAANDGTALVGSDYLTATGTLTFTPGVMTQTFTVSIINDLLDEADETVMLTLNNPTNAILGTPNPATLTLVDDDPPPTVQFSQSVFDVDENEGTATITVTLDAASALTVMVDYATSDGTATAGSDYLTATGTLTFAPNVLTQTFTVTITDDALDEADETITLTLSNPVNTVLGAPDSATLTIVDNDFSVFLPLIVK